MSTHTMAILGCGGESPLKEAASLESVDDLFNWKIHIEINFWPVIALTFYVELYNKDNNKFGYIEHTLISWLPFCSKPLKQFMKY